MKHKVRWLVSQLGAREHFAVPRALNLENELRVLYTDLWVNRNHFLPVPAIGSFKGLLERNHPGLPRNRVRSYNARFLGYEVAERLRLLSFNDDFDKYNYYGSRFAKAVLHDLKKLSLDPARDAFFGFTTTSLEVLDFLSQKGIPTILDQIDPGKWEVEMVINECNRWPGWSKLIPVINDSYFARLDAEWKLASKVLVNSSWTKQTLIKQQVPADKIIVVPLAYEPARDVINTGSVQPSNKEELQVLWIGSVILRKGIQYLIEAAKLLKDYNIRFKIAGPIGITEYAMKQAPPNMVFTGRIPRSSANQYYSEADVFVLPTLSDGFAITQIEAMSFGLPVITTPNCGDVVTNGINGFLVEAADSEGMATRILELYNNRELLQTMGEHARARSLDFTLQAYRKNLYDQI